ncbi:HAMP domain-containing sensor histidine kinase [Paenibacillus sp. LHD-38]|uniref:sensor histidine kinase n=1 Tax=Paenibacillus sp. LHD-38 TaxID=3072143 RepID=UPI00280CE85D|nr:HAMP domain-containing sensor histidine kinase [Paenibacillus sp. LHD-38]MDQ8733186.1 HAMP domain-containing sensor histidine kinase [Paenibacillus sp. LHD-38]
MIKRNRLKMAAASLAIALALTWLARLLLAFMIKIPPYDKPLKWIVEHIGSSPIMLASVILIFGLCYKKLFKQNLAWLPSGHRESYPPSQPSHPLFRTIRWTFMAAFLKSLGLMLCSVIAGHLFAFVLIQYTPYDRTLIWIVNHIGSTPVIALFGCLLFLGFFFWTSRNMILYLKEIRYGLQQMASGKLDHEIPVKAADELGEIASSINELGKQFNHLLQEERNTEKSKNDLITGVSHDLRTPLTSILGFLELIEQDRYQDEVELRYFVNIAYEKSKNLKGLIDDLFEYTKLNNDMPLTLAKLDIVGFVRQLAEEFVPSLEKAGMSCRIHTDEPAIWISADGELLARAYDNLIANAIQYGHAGKFIDIQVERLHEEAVIRIINFGDPIPAKDVPYIFDRFYRVDRSRTAESGGTGLGLAITKSIVESHSGKISVSSSAKETVFETCFPLL